MFSLCVCLVEIFWIPFNALLSPLYSERYSEKLALINSNPQAQFCFIARIDFESCNIFKRWLSLKVNRSYCNCQPTTKRCFKLWHIDMGFYEISLINFILNQLNLFQLSTSIHENSQRNKNCRSTKILNYIQRICDGNVVSARILNKIRTNGNDSTLSAFATILVYCYRNVRWRHEFGFLNLF